MIENRTVYKLCYCKNIVQNILKLNYIKTIFRKYSYRCKKRKTNVYKTHGFDGN